MPAPSSTNARLIRSRPAFSLVEMMVALAIVVIALSIVASVFAVTTRTTQTAQSLSEVNQAVTAFLNEMQQDLAAVNPAESVLVLSGWTQAAGLTADDVAGRRYYRVPVGDPGGVPNNYNPSFSASNNPLTDPEAFQYSDLRSDQMMFFTNRAGVSKAPPLDPGSLTDVSKAWQRYQRSLYDGVSVSPQMVVYGHAAAGRVAPGNNPWPDVSSLIEHVVPSNISGTDPSPGATISRLPALRWQLVRRAALIQPFDSKVTGTTSGLIDDLADGGDLDSALGDREEQLARLKLYRPGDQVAGDSLALDLKRYLAQFDAAGAPNITLTQPLALADPYLQVGGTRGARIWNAEARRLIFDLLYEDSAAQARRHIATVVEDAPARLQPNLGLGALPACVWFQVEFLLPEDPRNSREHGDAAQWDDAPRWVQVDPGRTFIFVPDTTANRNAIRAHLTATETLQNNRTRKFQRSNFGGNTAAFEPGVYTVRNWPWAIRITLRTLDPRGRLSDPIVRTLTHHFP